MPSLVLQGPGRCCVRCAARGRDGLRAGRAPVGCAPEAAGAVALQWRYLHCSDSSQRSRRSAFPLNVSKLLWEHVEFAVSLGPGCSRGPEPLNPALPGHGGRAAEHAAPGTCVRFSEQVAKLRAQQQAWPGHIKEVSGCAQAPVAAGRGAVLCGATRPSSSSPLPGAALRSSSAACASGCRGRKVPAAARTDKHGRPLLGRKKLSFFPSVTL